jgi:hypothetical protein
MNNQTGSMKDQKHTLAVLLWSLIAVTGGATLVWALSIPSDPKNAVLWGLSAERLLMVGLIIVLMVMCAFMASANAKKSALSVLALRFLESQRDVLRIVLPLALMAVGNVLLIPAVRFGDWQAYFLRLQPLLAWLFAGLLLAWLYLLLCFGSGWAALRTAWRDQRRQLIISAAVLAGFALLWLLMSITGLGLVPDIYWNEGSVPLMALQVWLALLMAGLFFVFERRVFKKAGDRKKLWYFDIIVMLLIWVITALVWQAQPMLRHSMLTEPSAPNFEYFSFSDAATYDIGARYVGLGQGINNQRATDKPFYLFVLGIFQMIAGYDYVDVILLQTIGLALLPAILYRVGMLMHSRPAGLLIAAFALFKEVNAMRATLDIQVSHSKLMMTEFPTALMLALTAWALLEWWHRTGGKRASVWLVWAGGLAAMTAMTRANAYVVVAATAGMVFLSGKISWKQVKLAGLFLLGFLLVATPWFLSGRTGRSAFAKFRFLTQTRYEQTTPLRVTPDQVLSYVPEVETSIQAERGMAWLTSTHFLHNLLGTTLAFPVQIPYHDLKTTLQASRWDSDWDGSLPACAAALMIANLAIVGIGMGFARKNNTFAGWLPLVFFLAYHAANGVVRNSGSRYLVPVEWAALVYYGIGFAQLAGWFGLWAFHLDARPLNDKTSALPAGKSSPLSWVAAGMLLLILGVSLPLAGALVPDHLTYLAEAESRQLLSEFGFDDALRQAGVDEAVWDDFLADERVIIFQGIAVNPRYMQGGEGMASNWYVFGTQDYARLAFIGLGLYDAGVILPYDEDPGPFPAGSEIFAIGCANPEREARSRSGQSNRGIMLRAVAVVRLTDDGAVHYLHPQIATALTCPVY